MKCDEMRETMPDLAAGVMEPSTEMQEHLRSCAPCTALLQEFRQTMALMDEWEAPEPSGFFDTRLMARLREEKNAEAARGRGWFAWLPRPALAMAMGAALVLAAGVGVFRSYDKPVSDGGKIATVQPGKVEPNASVQRGTAVGDLQTLDSDNDLYADFDVLDDIDSAQNPPAATNVEVTN